MTPERWQQIDNLLQQVIEIGPAERSALLAELCPGDPGLREEVESLMSFQELAPTFLAVPAVEENFHLLYDDHVDSMVGQTLGRYNIEALLGAGGMGEVYLAQDTKLDQKWRSNFCHRTCNRTQGRKNVWCWKQKRWPNSTIQTSTELSISRMKAFAASSSCNMLPGKLSLTDSRRID